MSQSHQHSASPNDPFASSRSGHEPRPGSRAAGKARSRTRLLQSAKRLFIERGYDGATVREIAAAAGLSTGAVFASFADKADLFDAVLTADALDQLEAMRAAGHEAGPAGQRMLKALNVGYAYHLKQLPLFQAAMAVSWSQGLKGDLGDRPVRQEVTQVLSQIVASAIESGELRPTADIRLIVETVWDCYVASYRLAAFGDASQAVLSERLKVQIKLILSGQRGEV